MYLHLGKISFFKYAPQVIASQRNISTHVNRTNCQLDFDAIPLDVVDYTWSPSQVVPVYPTKQASLRARCLFQSPWEKPGVASVHRPNVVWGVYLRMQVLVGVCCSARKIRCWDGTRVCIPWPHSSINQVINRQLDWLTEWLMRARTHIFTHIPPVYSEGQGCHSYLLSLAIPLLFPILLFFIPSSPSLVSC